MSGELRKMIAVLGFRLIDNMAQGQFVSTNSLFMKCALQTSLDLYYRRQLFYGILYCRFQLFDCFVLSCLFNCFNHRHFPAWEKQIDSSGKLLGVEQ